MEISQLKLNTQDKECLAKKGIKPETLEFQYVALREKKYPLELLAACHPHQGIQVLSKSKAQDLEKFFREKQSQYTMTKFVPASGAASRMFSDIEALQDETQLNILPPIAESLAKFLKKIEADLSCFPKGLVPFHYYSSENYFGETRNAFQEHLVEALAYQKDRDQKIRVHFTLHPDFYRCVEENIQIWSQQNSYPMDFLEVTYSTQSPKTEAISLDEKWEPLRVNERLLLRPGGHGALLKNLQEINSDLVFIRNIDNIGFHPDAEEKIFWSKILAAYLIKIQEKIFFFLRRIQKKENNVDFILELKNFLHSNFFYNLEDSFFKQDLEKQLSEIYGFLNRPLRICGVVPNQGQVGGAPFWVKDIHGNKSLQLVESIEINHLDPAQEKLFKNSTHFNPVNMVCSFRDFRGAFFRLEDFCDSTRVLISEKNYGEQKIRVFEWPGLWNGGMAYWNTIFLELPIETFTPVKVWQDLLKRSN
ncbi:MAG: DUF4301 family protein [Deltaproteobacteria bacterium]|nr:DUF4301 family protein [Deltaproteobacteria bacterium]